MAFKAAHPLALVLLVAEIDFEGFRGCRSAGKLARLVTGGARGNILSVRLGARGMTLKTSCVRGGSRRYRQRHSLTRRLMAIGAGNILMSRVRESHAEAFQRREGFYLAAPCFRAGMANGAYRAARSSKLLRVATGARSVLQRTNRPGRVALAAMAQQARKPFMTSVVM
jgi:hypothetical protein